VFAYIIRRLLYSIPVLLATSFLIFTFVSITGDPLGKIRANPRISAAELASLSQEREIGKSIRQKSHVRLSDAEAANALKSFEIS